MARNTHAPEGTGLTLLMDAGAQLPVAARASFERLGPAATPLCARCSRSEEFQVALEIAQCRRSLFRYLLAQPVVVDRMLEELEVLGASEVLGTSETTRQLRENLVASASAGGRDGSAVLRGVRELATIDPDGRLATLVLTELEVLEHGSLPAYLVHASKLRERWCVARNRLVEPHLYLALQFVDRAKPRDPDERQKMLTAAEAELAKAADRFDPTSKSRFSTSASRYLSRAFPAASSK